MTDSHEIAWDLIARIYDITAKEEPPWLRVAEIRHLIREWHMGIDPNRTQQ